MRQRLSMLLIAVTCLAAASAASEDLNGFTISRQTVPREEILKGGPPRDGIKSVDEPEFSPVAEASWVAADTPVLGVAVGGEARVYPIHLMEYHQIVNDVLGAVPIAVTYDPLAGTAMVYSRKVGDRELHFGVSGLIYESNFLLYDRETQSLWSQYRGKAISGPLAGQALSRLPARQEPHAAWLQRHPDSKVLNRPFPKTLDYRYSPFSSYWISDKIPFPVKVQDKRYHPKEVVLGVSMDGKQRVYIASIVKKAGGRIVDDFAGRKIRVAYDAGTSTFLWEGPEDVIATDAYWFAWKNFHPETEIWNDANPRPPAGP